MQLRLCLVLICCLSTVFVSQKAFSSDGDFQRLTVIKKCDGAKSLEVCINGHCNNAACDGGSFCVTDSEINHGSASCIKPDRLTASCHTPNAINYEAVVGTQTLNLSQTCNADAPYCSDGMCSTARADVAIRQ